MRRTVWGNHNHLGARRRHDAARFERKRSENVTAAIIKSIDELLRIESKIAASGRESRKDWPNEYFKDDYSKLGFSLNNMINNAKPQKPNDDSGVIFLRKLKSMADRKANLSPADRKQLLQSIHKKINLFSISEIAQLTWCIGTLKLSVRSQEMVTLTDIIFDRLSASKLSLTAEDTVMALIGFARLGVQFSRVAPNSFLEVLSTTLKVMDAQQVANTIWSLGKTKILWQSLPIRSQKALNEAVIRQGMKMAPQGVANSIQGISNMGCRWDTLSNGVASTILDALKATLPSMKEQEVSNSISGLGRLGVDWIKLPLPVRQAIFKAFLRTSNDLSNQGLAMTIHGLGKMNVNIESLPPILQANFVRYLEKFTRTLNAQEVSNIVYGFGKMNAHRVFSTISFSSLQKSPRDILCAMIERESWQMTAQGVANTLWGLMLLHFSWGDLEPKVQHSLVMSLTRESRKMTEQELGTTIYALGKLKLTNG